MAISQQEASAGGATAGAAIGFAFGGLPGAGLGAALGGSVGGLFGKSKKKKKYRPPTLGPLGMQAQASVRNAANEGISGGGIFAGKRAVIKQQTKNELTSEFQRIRGGLSSNLDRIVSPEDRKVRDYALNKVNTDYARALEDLDNQDIMQNYQDTQTGIGLGLSSLAQERRVASSVGNINFQSQMNQMQSPTFGTELNRGLGGAAAYFAKGMGGIG